MPNLRVIYNNVADRAASIAASTNANLTALPASNMQNDYKGKVHRSTGTSVTYTLTWSTAQRINGLVLPCTNLSSSATILVQLYSSNTTLDATTLLNNTTPNNATIDACLSTSLQEWTNAGYSNTTINANLFPYGGLSKTSRWFTQTYTGVLGLKITLIDTGSKAGYIDCSRIICGEYWSPTYNVDRSGLLVNVVDSSTISRTDNGDLLAEQGFKYDQLSFNLGVLADSDRNTLLDIIRTYGTAKNILISVFPDGTNSKQEQIYTVYGKRDNSDISYLFPGLSSHGIKITGW